MGERKGIRTYRQIVRQVPIKLGHQGRSEGRRGQQFWDEFGFQFEWFG